MITKIQSSEISVVVQGAIDQNNTPLCITSIRKYLPKAEIILSTWEGSDTENLDYDILVLNKDPGGYSDICTKFVNNLNRQLVSTSNGIKKASKKYCLKLRSDLILKSSNFLKYYMKFDKRDEKYSVFRERVIFCSLFFKRYMGEVGSVLMPTPFHISDWLAFGLKEDIGMLFGVKLAEEPQNTDYLVKNKIKTLKFNLFGASHQYAPEQYIFYQMLKENKKDVAEFRNILDFNNENITESEKYIVNNCIPLDANQFNIYCGKNGVDPYRIWSQCYLTIPEYIWEGLYRYDIFLKDYIKYCDSDYKAIAKEKIALKVYLGIYNIFHKILEVRR